MVLQWLPLPLVIAGTVKLQQLLLMAFPFTQGQVHILVAFNRMLNKLVLLDTVRGCLEVCTLIDRMTEYFHALFFVYAVAGYGCTMWLFPSPRAKSTFWWLSC